MNGINAATATHAPTVRTLTLYAISIMCCALLVWDTLRRGRFHFEPASGIGYALGLIGGLMTLTLLLYSLRKRAPFMRNCGPLKHWFRVHMVIGILGPLLVVIHTALYVGSLNAAVALSSMLVVAGSGVVGRFIYRHIHHGLYGHRATLAEIQAELERTQSSVWQIRSLADTIEPRLQAFARAAIQPHESHLARFWNFLAIGYRAWLTRRACERDSRMALRMHAASANKEALHRHRREVQDLVANYLKQVKRVAQFQSYEQLFSMWHVLHVPLVLMLFISAVIHVLAVHIY